MSVTALSVRLPWAFFGCGCFLVVEAVEHFVSGVTFRYLFQLWCSTCERASNQLL